MTFDARETSADEGEPIELYTWIQGDQFLRYTGADRTLVVDGQTYQRAVLTREAVEDGPELRRSFMRIVSPRDFPPANLFRVSPPTAPVTFILQQAHIGTDDIVQLWTGRVVDVEWTGSAARMTLEPLFSAIKRNGLRRKFGTMCPHVLYGNDCKVNPLAYRLERNAGDIVGLTLEVADVALQPDGYYAGGFIEYTRPGNVVERRFIVSHTGTQLELMTAPVGLSTGSQVRVYPGCDHSADTCAGKFSNALNFGGFPYSPDKNPFSSSDVFPRSGTGSGPAQPNTARF